MKKYVVLFLCIGFMLFSASISAQEVKKSSKKSKAAQKSELKQKVLNDTAAKQDTASLPDTEAVKPIEKEIVKKELTTNKNKKVKRFDLDKSLKTSIENRNIP